VECLLLESLKLILGGHNDRNFCSGIVVVVPGREMEISKMVNLCRVRFCHLVLVNDLIFDCNPDCVGRCKVP
jgi:hypothetical protein